MIAEPVPGAVRLLIVEDERSIASLLERSFARAGYDVRVCLKGAEALEAGGGFRVAIIDCSLPDMDGRVLARRLRETEPQLRVVLTSGMPIAPGEGARFVQKPFLPSELVKVVEEVLACG